MNVQDVLFRFFLFKKFIEFSDFSFVSCGHNDPDDEEDGRDDEDTEEYGRKIRRYPFKIKTGDKKRDIDEQAVQDRGFCQSPAFKFIEDDTGKAQCSMDSGQQTVDDESHGLGTESVDKGVIEKLGITIQMRK